MAEGREASAEPAADFDPTRSIFQRPEESGAPWWKRCGGCRGCSCRCRPGPLSCRRPAFGLRCRRGHRELVLRVNRHKLEELRNSVDDDATLTQELVIEGEVLVVGTKVLKVGGSKREGEDVVGALQEAVMCGQAVRIVFSAPWMGCMATMVLRRPCCTIVAMVVAIVALIVVGLPGLSLQTDMSSFMESDGINSAQYAAMVEAIADNREQGGRRLQSSVSLYNFFSLLLLYKSEPNLLTFEKIQAISAFELSLRELPEFKDMCSIAEPIKKRFCEEGLSLANVVFPSVSELQAPFGQAAAVEALGADGRGGRAVPLVIAMLLARKTGIDRASLPTDLLGGKKLELPSFMRCQDRDERCALWRNEGQCLPLAEHEVFMRDFCPKTCGFCDREVTSLQGFVQEAAGEQVRVARSVFGFHAYCCEATDNQGELYGKLKERWAKFVAAVIKFVEEHKDELKENLDIEVFYEGSSFEGYEAQRALMSDLKWASAAYGFVFIYAIMYTRSIILAFFGLTFVMLSIPTGLAIFFILSGSTEVSIILGIAIFIVIGVGSDMMFVYTDFWKHSLEHSRRPTRRLRYLHSQASTSTAATTFTTATSFLANLISVLRPLREFGFVMGITMIMAWLILFLTYPPLLVINERIHRRAQALFQELSGKAGRLSASQARQSRRENSVVKRQTSNTAALAFRATRTFAKLVDPEKHGIGELQSNFMSGRLVLCINKLRLVIVGMVVAFTGWAIWISSVNVKQDGGVPQLFFPDHNQVAVKPYSAMFSSFDVADHSLVSEKGSRCSDLFGSCDSYTCTTVGQRLGSASTCHCVVEEDLATDMSSCSSYEVEMSIVGHKTFLASPVTAAAVEKMVRGMSPDAEITSAPGVATEPATVEALAWETGEQEVAALRRLSPFQMKLPASYRPKCGTEHFTMLSGRTLEEIQVSGGTAAELSAKCCAACAARGDCEFWVREAFSNQMTQKCWLRSGPEWYTDSPNHVGGWHNRSLTPAVFQDVLGTAVDEVQITGFSDAGLDEQCCAACRNTPTCEYWVRNTTTFSLDDPRTVKCYLKREPRVHLASAGLRGGWRCGTEQYPQGQLLCQEQWTCYCDARRCTNMQQISSVATRGTLELDPPGRFLQAAGGEVAAQFSVPPSQRVDVNIVFGIEALDLQRLLGASKDPKWKYLSSFRLEDPWAQRHTMSLCEDLPAELKVATMRCWMVGFRDQRLTNGEEFPVRLEEDFHGLARRYVTDFSVDGFQTTDFVYFDDAGRIRAMYITAFLDVTLWYSASKAMDLLALWDQHFQSFNAKVGSPIKGVWHASRLWVRAEAEKLIVDSTLMTVVIALLCVWLGVVIFTRSVMLGMIVMAMVACIVADLLFFMVIVMGWALGAIEVLSLIIFIGFAVDYCLHVAHEYHACQISLGDELSPADFANPRNSRHSVATSTNGEQVRMKATTFRRTRFQTDHQRELRKQNKTAERFERSRFSLECMGSAVFGSAVTTVGCACFLLPCTLAVFFKIGAVVISVTIFAVIHALFPLPAVLMTIGPCNHDFRSFLELVKQFSEKCLGDPGSDLEVEFSSHPKLSHATKQGQGRSDSYLVLNMPARGVAQAGAEGAAAKASRTLVRIAG